MKRTAQPAAAQRPVGGALGAGAAATGPSGLRGPKAAGTPWAPPTAPRSDFKLASAGEILCPQPSFPLRPPLCPRTPHTPALLRPPKLLLRAFARPVPSTWTLFPASPHCSPGPSPFRAQVSAPCHHLGDALHDHPSPSHPCNATPLTANSIAHSGSQPRDSLGHSVPRAALNT